MAEPVLDIAPEDLEGLKPFTRRHARTTNAPTLSIQKGGGATLNVIGGEAIGNPSAVDLFFNEERKLLALQAASPESPYAYPLRNSSGRGRHYVLSLAALLTHYGIPAETMRGRYRGALFGDRLVFDLKRPLAPDQESSGQ
ncbi:MAG: hypothetical protein JOZ41_04805 [Chloroflexi bacterium]|nr:hypothetical protein [Chloroflexota bacterium]